MRHNYFRHQKIFRYKYFFYTIKGPIGNTLFQSKAFMNTPIEKTGFLHTILNDIHNMWGISRPLIG